jgi:glutamate synthase domain-containing protein 2/glutamate synthase domain-containing protein 1/glutamate synthase domain-containing protein 3
MNIPYEYSEKASCGVGFLVSLDNTRNHETLIKSLKALICVEHRGGTGADNRVGDGSGIMTAIPYELFGLEKETFAVASLFTPTDTEKHDRSLTIFEETFSHFGLIVSTYRDVPIDKSVLSSIALANRPKFKQAIIQRPKHCRTLASFEKLLYMAKQMTITAQKEAGVKKDFFFASLSSRTIVYKALCIGEDLPKFYLDLQNPKFITNFSLFHRRFSTNTLSSWDKVQPFRLIAHNGEINTIEGNKAWSVAREKALGLRKDELITHDGVSDSGNVNGIVEALRNRSCIPQTSEILSILMPPANKESCYYNFWSRGMEPWDGPALVVYCDGKTIGARLDRNGLRPCRWTKTDKHFYLCSETGTFDIDDSKVEKKGALYSGASVTINALAGGISFLDSSELEDNKDALFEAHLEKFDYQTPAKDYKHHQTNLGLFSYSKEDVVQFIDKMIIDNKEPIGSMGDTARLAFLSDLPRSLFDFFYQDFAQVTNPPLDYIREKTVTDMRVYLGRKPNIFEPKEFIPPKASLLCEGPIISLGQMEKLISFSNSKKSIKSKVIPTLFKKEISTEEFVKTLDRLKEDCIQAVKEGHTILILSDRLANENNLPIPSLLALQIVGRGLNGSGRRLRTSVILDSGDIKNSHHVACLLSFGATAVCPYMILERAYFGIEESMLHIFPKEREQRLITILNTGILRIMAKLGISVLRSYQGSKLLTMLGLSKEVSNLYFPGKKSSIGGLSLESLVNKIKTDALESNARGVKKSFIYKEHATGKLGETHSITSLKTKVIHKLTNEPSESKRAKIFKEFKYSINGSASFLRHLMSFNKSSTSLSLEKISHQSEILKTFGSGGMSFGAISAESQRDLILAFREIGGRCNSGEGGENPYFLTEGIYANVKQLASGRFGVTCEYLITGEEVQIKIAQGAKPGEGGQLMGLKITAEIAKARFANIGVDLISPPPQHDIYSIEDLKQLIYELKQLKPSLKVSVKLVSGRNIGAIAVGVVKAGADIIQISGGDGGTGAASLLSMKHAGLPLEIGLIEVHHSLVSTQLRSRVILRADGGLMTGKDIVMSAILGADQFDFGKIVLVAEGCVMARVCEKNTCPAGIATHDPKFKANYKGNKDKVVILLKELANDVRHELSMLGKDSLQAIRGNTNLLKMSNPNKELAVTKGFSLDFFHKLNSPHNEHNQLEIKLPNKLNQEIITAVKDHTELNFKIKNTDRAIPASLTGLYGALKSKGKIKWNPILWNKLKNSEKVSLSFQGSAGQGFGIFLTEEIKIKLSGEANDSVAKGLCGGEVFITPPKKSTFEPSENTIIGNCALYGATSGDLLVYGRGGDRFAVRNSGANAIIEGVGIHACEYMTDGKIIILGQTLGNIGAGMNGGTLYLAASEKENINHDYLVHAPFHNEDMVYVQERLNYYIDLTGSKSAIQMLESLEDGEFPLIKFVSKKLSTQSM